MIKDKFEINNIPHYTESVFYEMKRTAQIMKIHANQLFQTLNIELSPEEYAILDIVTCNSEICQRDIAKLSLKDRANTGRILARLESLKLIKRTIDTKNNRLVKNVKITQKGSDKLDEINRNILLHYKEITEKIPREEVEATKTAVKKLRESIEQHVKNKI